jgi:N-methylhydantoinase A
MTGANGTRRVFDPAARSWTEAPVHERSGLAPGDTIDGPAIIVEDQTTTIVPAGMRLQVNGFGYLDLTAKDDGS